MNYCKPGLLLFLLATSIVALAQGNDAAKPNADAEKAVIKIEQEMSTALTKSDADAVAKMLGDSYYSVGPDGAVSGKKEFVADLKSGKFKLESNKLDDMKV